MAAIIHQLREAPGLAGRLPPEMAGVVEDALAGDSVYDIANRHELSVEAARLASGDEPRRRVEVGGLGSDTDPGVTGGYGETGFGSLGLEPPYPIPEEPGEGRDEEPEPGG